MSAKSIGAQGSGVKFGQSASQQVAPRQVVTGGSDFEDAMP